MFLKRRRKRGRQKKQRHQQRRYPKNASSNHFILKDEARPKIWQKESCVHTLKYARFSIDSVTRLFKTTRFCFIENSINSFSQNLMVFKLSHSVWKSQKSLIQYCERSELHLHFMWTKVYKYGQFLKTISLRSNSVTRQVIFNKPKIEKIKWDILGDFGINVHWFFSCKKSLVFYLTRQ